MTVMGRRRQGAVNYLIVRQPDDTQAYLPEWMTMPESVAQASIVEMATLSLEALLALRRE